ncbi:MAG: hypothetical protein V8Q84_07280 [Bilophila sp.]
MCEFYWPVRCSSASWTSTEELFSTVATEVSRQPRHHLSGNQIDLHPRQVAAPHLPPVVGEGGRSLLQLL